MSRHGIACTLCFVVTFSAAGVGAQTRGEDETLSLRGGIGFTADPGSFLLGAQLPIAISPEFAIGPELQLGIDDDTTFFAPTWMGEFRIPLGESDFVPYVHAGVGAAYLEKERPGPDPDDWGFLINVGFGGDFWVNDTVSVGTRVNFDIMPDDVLGEHFLFSWQVVTGRFSF